MRNRSDNQEPNRSPYARVLRSDRHPLYDDHRSLLQRVEDKLSRLLGDYPAEMGPDSSRLDDVGAAVSDPYAYDEEGDLRLFGGPHVDAPGWDPGFAGPRFDRIDVGSTGTHGAHPVASFYGAGYGIGSRGFAGTSARQHYLARQGLQRDPRYDHWRESELERIDSDYDDYRRERQAQFDREFDQWRSRRQEKRRSLERVKRGMDVIDCDEQPVGTVEAVAGDHILVSHGGDGGDTHLSIPCAWIKTVDVRVVIDRPASEAQQSWQHVENERGGGRTGESFFRSPSAASSPSTRR